MAKKAQQDDVQEQPVDRYGRPLPLVMMRDKAGAEVAVRDAVGLSSLHYTSGMEFAEDGMTYAKALALLLGDSAEEHLLPVSTEDGPEAASGDSQSDDQSG